MVECPIGYKWSVPGVECGDLYTGFFVTTETSIIICSTVSRFLTDWIWHARRWMVLKCANVLCMGSGGGNSGAGRGRAV